MRVFLYLSLIILPLQCMGLEAVDHVDLNRYLGKWYEIARFDSWFEKNCKNVTAVYTLIDNNKIGVVNTCVIDLEPYKVKQAKGRATVVDHKTNAKLSVSFLPRFLSWFDTVFGPNYWILKLEKDYSVALVGDKSMDYLWILSRNPSISKTTYDSYVSTAKDMGFDIKKLHKTVQSWNE